MSVTDQDRAKGSELLHRLVAGSRQGVACSCGWFGPGSNHDTHAVDAIAAALAAERGKARAPFLALIKAWEDDSRSWYYANRYTHEYGIDYVAGYEAGWEHADGLLRKAAEDQP